ncbi:MAG TPA: hypothetical protein VHE30_10600 [Polyangiaceae bacterium]|nr:hypothetical protein [Polyangiaceae bacterium]
MTDPSGDREERPTRAVLAVAATVHLGLLWYFVPLRVLFAKQPFVTFDYALHVYQVDRAVRAFRDSGHLWSWDPFTLAGHPAGALEDMTIRALELFVIAAGKAGVSTWVAFDVGVLLVPLGLPFAAWASARFFGLSRLASAVTVLAWVLAWHFDSLLHWFFYVGMISWGAASYLSVLVAAAMYRATTRHDASSYVVLGLLATLATLVHPFAPLVLVPTSIALYARAFRGLAFREHGALLLCAACAASTVLTWIGPALRFRHLVVGRIDLFLMPDPSYVVSDYLGLLRDVLQTGQPVRTAFRTAFFVLALISLFRLRRSRDARTLPFALLVLSGVSLAYLGTYSGALRQTQPYRNLGPSIFAAALVGAELVVEIARTRELRQDARSRAALLLGAVAVVPVLGGTMLGYLPTLLPGGPKLGDPPRELARPGRELDPVVMGHDGPSPEYAAVARYLHETVGTSGRVAVTDWALGEWLVAFADVPILGGIPQRYVPQALAHPLRADFTPRSAGDDPVARYLSDYAVAAVVTSGPLGPFDARPDLLLPADGFGPYRIYRTTRTPSYFAVGTGSVRVQALNRIVVAKEGTGDVVLRFHHLETLRCRPNCELVEEKRPGEQASFIRVRNSPAAFEIENAYE